jgi:glycosyltransferase involved in cell wall biosynthesis
MLARRRGVVGKHHGINNRIIGYVELMMKISCLTITRVERVDLLRRCLHSYSRQTIDSACRELVIVHHDGNKGTKVIQGLLAAFNIAAIIVDVPPAPLGTLRNISIESASGDLLCQWDDDDFYHPDRLRMQAAPFTTDKCIATTLDSQLLWFCASGELYVRRGAREGIHGTVMFRKGRALQYEPTMSKGEDSRFMQALLLQDPAGIRRIDGHPELYVRTYHGRNTWDLDDFRKQTQQALNAEWLKENEAFIRDWIRVLQIPDVKVSDTNDVAFTVRSGRLHMTAENKIFLAG